MNKKLIYIAMVLFISLFFISACEQIKGGIITPKEVKTPPIVYKNYVEFTGKEKESNMYMNEEDGIIYYKTTPLFSLNSNDNVNQMNTMNFQQADQNINNNRQLDELQFYRWESANTNHGISGKRVVRDRNGEIISIRFIQGGVEENIPLIRERRVVYPNGRYFTFEFTGVTEEMLEEMPAVERASTLRFRTYYVNDLMPILRLRDDEGDERVIDYFKERLEEWGNDMNFSIRTIVISKSIPNWDRPDDEEFVKWFVTYIQYFDEEGIPITELPKGITLSTMSERWQEFQEGFRTADGYSGLTGSRWNGDNLVLEYDGFEWGNFEEEEIEDEIYENWFHYHLPIFEGRIRELEPVEAFV